MFHKSSKLKFVALQIPFNLSKVGSVVYNVAMQIVFVCVMWFTHINNSTDSVQTALKDENVVGAFTYLLSKLQDVFATVDFDKFQDVCMLRGAQFPQEYKQQIKAARGLGDIFDVFEQHKLYCNWLNVRLLKRIAKNLDNRRAVKLIQIYEDNVYCRKVSDVKRYFSICFDETTVTMIKVKINKSHEGITIKQLIDNYKELEEIMDIYTGTVSLKGSEIGCLKITIVIPLHCCLHAFNMAKKNFLKLRQYHIQYLEIESFPKVFALNYPDSGNTLPLDTLKCMYSIF